MGSKLNLAYIGSHNETSEHNCLKLKKKPELSDIVTVEWFRYCESVICWLFTQWQIKPPFSNHVSFWQTLHITWVEMALIYLTILFRQLHAFHLKSFAAEWWMIIFWLNHMVRIHHFQPIINMLLLTICDQVAGFIYRWS